MRRIPIFLFMLVLAVISAGVIAVTSQSTVAQIRTSADDPTPTPSQRALHQYLQVIQPSTTKMQAKVLPTFTVADVEKYLQLDPFQGHTLSGTQPTHTITFMTSQDVGARLHKDFSGEAPILCYVEFQGPLYLDKGIVALNSKPQTYAFGYEVIDGRTGELIVWGAGYQAPSSPPTPAAIPMSN